MKSKRRNCHQFKRISVVLILIGFLAVSFTFQTCRKCIQILDAMYKNFEQMFLAWASTSQEKGSPAHMLWKLMCDDPCLCSRVRTGSLWLIEGTNDKKKSILIWFLWNCEEQGAIRVELVETQDSWARESQRPSIQSFARKVAGCRLVLHKQDRCVATLSKGFFFSCKTLICKITSLSHSSVWSHLSHLASEAFWSYQRLPKTCAAWKKPFFIFLKHLFTI